jgi:hypothetical protein
MHRSHECHISQQDYDGFPPRVGQDIEAVQVQTILDASNRETIQLGAKLDILMYVVASFPFLDCRLRQMHHGIQAHIQKQIRATHYRCRPLQPWLGCYAATGVLCSTRKSRSEPETSSSSLLVDAGTANGVKLVHALIANPSPLPEWIPLEPYEFKLGQGSLFSISQ